MKRFLSDLKCDTQVGIDGAMGTSQFRWSDYRLVMIHEEMVLADGQNVSRHFLRNAEQIPVIIYSDQTDVRKAVEAVQNGAFDYFTKDSDQQAMQTSLIRALKLTAESGKRNMRPLGSKGQRPMISHSKKMANLLRIAERVAKSDATVLIEGESGTGKELLARFIHERSTRADKPYVAMNCAALPESLAESELFGYGKGAFTGATRSRTGKFEQAQGGTLMLDEISEMPLSLQVKLLRVLQEKEVDPIGGCKPVSIDVRVVATSNRELAQMVKAGAFRQDLYYRLRVIPLSIPSLRERKDDIPILVAHFMDKFRALHQIEDLTISPDALAQLSGWSWPGNVRELENTIERATLICDGVMIRPEHLLIEEELSSPESSNPEKLVGMTVKEIEKKLINQTLQHVNENRTHAAQMLGISIRTLRNKLHEYANTNEPDIQAASGNKG